MLRTRMTTLAFILSELFPLDGFRCNFDIYFDDILQLCRTGHDDVSCTRITTLAFILSELYPLNSF